MIRVFDGPLQWITEHRCGFDECDPMKDAVTPVLRRIPLELHDGSIAPAPERRYGVDLRVTARGQAFGFACLCFEELRSGPREAHRSSRRSHRSSTDTGQHGRRDEKCQEPPQESTPFT